MYLQHPCDISAWTYDTLARPSTTTSSSCSSLSLCTVCVRRNGSRVAQSHVLKVRPHRSPRATAFGRQQGRWSRFDRDPATAGHDDRRWIVREPAVTRELWLGSSPGLPHTRTSFRGSGRGPFFVDGRYPRQSRADEIRRATGMRRRVRRRRGPGR